MSLSLVSFIGSALAAAIFTPAARRLALRLGVIDVPLSARKIHSGSVPRLGGVAVCGAFCVGIALLAGFASGRTLLATSGRAVLGFVAAMITITAAGVWDD